MLHSTPERITYQLDKWKHQEVERLYSEKSFLNANIDLAKPKSGVCNFFSPHVSRTQRLTPARNRTRVVGLGAQCTDHWTTGQSRGVGVPAVQLTKHFKSSTLYGRTVVLSCGLTVEGLYGRTVVRSCGRTVVRSYIQIFWAWWDTTILYNYGATQAPLLLFTILHALKHNTSFRSIKPPWSCTLILEKIYHQILDCYDREQ